MLPKRWFGYELWHGRVTPVLYYDELPTNGNGKATIALMQKVEVPTKLFNLDLTQLSLIYPYVDERVKDETFKIS